MPGLDAFFKPSILQTWGSGCNKIKVMSKENIQLTEQRARMPIVTGQKIQKVRYINLPFMHAYSINQKQSIRKRLFYAIWKRNISAKAYGLAKILIVLK